MPSSCLSESPLPISVGMIQNRFSCSFCSYYNTKSVLLCLGITALVCLSVTIFSFQSKVGPGGQDRECLEGSGYRTSLRDVGMSPQGWSAREEDEDVLGCKRGCKMLICGNKMRFLEDWDVP